MGFNIKVFTSSTSWTAPAGVTKIFAIGYGGGGPGGPGGTGTGTSTGFSGGGGGGAQLLNNFATVVPNISYTITIGGSGGATTFGSAINFCGAQGALGQFNCNAGGSNSSQIPSYPPWNFGPFSGGNYGPTWVSIGQGNTVRPYTTPTDVISTNYTTSIYGTSYGTSGTNSGNYNGGAGGAGGPGGAGANGGNGNASGPGSAGSSAAANSGAGGGGGGTGNGTGGSGGSGGSGKLTIMWWD